MTKILLVGPSKRIKEKAIPFYEDYRKKGYIIVSYTGAIAYLFRLKFVPDYFAFFDPYTIYQYEKWIKKDSKYFAQNTLLAYNIYKNNLEDFKTYGYSTAVYRNSKIEEKTQYLETLFSYFKSINLKTIDNLINLLDLKQDYYDFSEQLLLFTGYGKISVDKFCGVLLPLVLNIYKDIDHIHCIGFGDFKVKRCGGTSSGYTGYIKCAKIVCPLIKQYLKKNNINISFEHSKSNTFYDLLKK